MSFLEKIRNTFGVDVIEEEVEETEEAVKEEEPKSSDMTKITPASERYDFKSYKPIDQNTGAVATANTTKFTSQWKLEVVVPTDFNDSSKLVDSLKAKKPVIINLENLETDVARKIFDFLSGATYALNGNVKKIANNIFIFTPENVDVAYNQNLKSADEKYKNPWR